MRKMTLQDILNLGAELLQTYGLTDWTMGFNRQKRNLGLCRYRVKRIELSIDYALTASADSIVDTIKHEVAHAITGPGHGHDDVWKATAVRVGATPQRCAVTDGGMKDVFSKPKYIAACACGQPHTLYRKPKRMEGWYCKRIGRKDGALTWKSCY
jgi:predicted SprT family Zn-dependent metalloprotease